MIDIQIKREKKRIRRELASIGLSDTAISKITTIPVVTLAKWKKREFSDWRKKIYQLLKSSDESFLIEKFQK